VHFTVLEGFYSNLFSKKITDINQSNKWVGKIKNKLLKESRDKLRSEISVSEMKEVVGKMKKRKSPGSDRLGAKVYVKMEFLLEWLKVAWEEAVREGKLWESARLALIRTIHKGGEVNLIKNFRPISLCNVDYKIVAKVLASRVGDVIGSVIDEEQAGFVKGRDIRNNILVARAVVKALSKGRDGGVLLLDFEKAYDRLDREFLWRCMEGLEMGEEFIEMVKVLHKDTKARVILRSGMTDEIEVVSEVRQGSNCANFICNQRSPAVVRTKRRD
jgi:hypothetical protein